MGRAGGLLVNGTAEEHLRIGALEDAGDAGAPLELLLDDRPGLCFCVCAGASFDERGCRFES